MLKLLLVVAIFAVATYLITRALQERGEGATPTRRPSLPKQFPKLPQQRRTVAPDDDEEFLRDLERKRRHGQDPEA